MKEINVKTTNKGEVTEFCPHCETEVTIHWNTLKDGYKTFCPYCGGRLMLCDECLHAVYKDGECQGCDYCTETDLCKRSPVSKN